MSLTSSEAIRASPLSRALDVIGDRWTLLILRDAFLGLHRFEQWQRHLGIARRLLADRLKRLVTQGLLERTPYQAHRLRYDYHLTPSGHDLYGLALMIRRWERHWGTGVDAVVGELTLIHRSCGSKIEPQCVCIHCGQVVTARQTSFEDRPDASREPHVWKQRQRRSRVISSEAPNHGPFLQDAIDILGDRWTYLVLAAAFCEARRYTSLRRVLGIATNILSDRLVRLVEAEILEHVPSKERPQVYEYVLTEKGLDLFPVIVALLQWGERWLSGSHKPSLTLNHHPCGRRLKSSIICDVCGGVLRSSNVEYRLPKRDPKPAKRATGKLRKRPCDGPLEQVRRTDGWRRRHAAKSR
jgi:DNA-binding HxlR family transcriptional regulator